MAYGCPTTSGTFPALLFYGSASSQRLKSTDEIKLGWAWDFGLGQLRADFQFGQIYIVSYNVELVSSKRVQPYISLGHLGQK